MLAVLPLAASLLQPLLAPLVLLCAAGAAFYGFRRGLFRAILLGLQALAAVMLALALEPPLAAWLELTEVPPAYALPGAFVAVLVAAAVGLMLLVNAVVPADAVRLPPKIDQIAGAAVGLVAGVIASGGLLVALSMTPLPAAYRPDFGRLALDTGGAVLTTFARSLGYDARTVSLVLDGEPGARIDPGTKPRPAAWSEPFVDTNANLARDPDEPFLDTDADGAFTPQLAANDVNDDGRRDVGLLERYRLGQWTPLRVLQAPALTSEDSEFVTDGAPASTVVYQAAATDADAGDTLRFSLKPDQEDDAALVTLDPTTGAVTLKSPPDRAVRPVYTFTVVVTDRAGLVAEKPVTIYVTKGRESDRESTPQPAPDPS